MIALVLAATLAQGPSPLVRAESLLVAGDTAAAIDVLAAVPWVDSLVSDAGVRATVALEWIGRSPRWGHARDLWDARASRLTPTKDGPPVVVAVSSVHIVNQRLLPMVDLVPRMAALADSVGSDSGIAAATIRWGAAETELDVLSDGLFYAAPALEHLPEECAPHAAEACDLREDPPPNARAIRAVATSSTNLERHLERVVSLLRADTADAWPFWEIAARTAVALEVVLGSNGSRLRARGWIATLPLDASTRARADAVLYHFAGRRDSALATVAAHADVFAGYDTTLADLDENGRLPPPVLWRTGWPLYLEPFNERLLVHRARLAAVPFLNQVFAERQGALTPYADAVAFVRRGLPMAITAFRIVTKERVVATLITYPDSRTEETLLPFRNGGGGLDLDVALAARNERRGRSVSGFVAHDYDHLGYLDNQVVRYLRDGHVHVDFFVQPVRVPPVLQLVPCADASAVVGFFLQGNNLGLLHRSVDTLPPGQMPAVRYPMVLAPGAYVFSLEMLDPACHAASRARFPLAVQPPAAGLSMSDIVLADRVSVTNPTRVSGMLGAEARPSLSVAAGETVHLYWEVYGLVAAGAGDPDRIKVEMQAVNVRQGLVPVGQLGAVQRDANAARPVAAVSYMASVPAGDEPLGMSMLMQMPPTAGGVHQVRIVVTDTKTGRRAQASRTFNVTRGRGRR